MTEWEKLELFLHRLSTLLKNMNLPATSQAHYTAELTLRYLGESIETAIEGIEFTNIP